MRLKLSHMKTLLLSLGLLLASAGVYAQNFAIGSTTITFTDPSRGNRAIETTVYYPATAAGNNTPVAGTGIKFPVISFGHGFVMTTAAYDNIWSSLVPEGFIVALPKTEGSILPDHDAFGRDLAFVISSLQTAGNTSGNLFNGKVSATSCVMGHSMGGGASFLAVQYLPTITAIAGLAPAETNPSASGAAAAITIPALIFAGGNDCVTPAAQHSQLIYNNTGSDCKSYINILGGSHCQFANQNFNCSFGELTCSHSPTISRATQQGKVNQYLIPWLNFRLKDQCQEWYAMQNQLGADATVSLLQDCLNPVICVSPGGRRTKYITKKSAFLKWNPTNCYSTFDVRIKPSSSTTWTTIPGLTSNTYQLTGLLANTSYDWSVRAVCDAASGNFSPWGTKQTFTTLLVNPSNLSFLKEAETNINIIPNPGNGNFDLQISSAIAGSATITLNDMQGREIISQQIFVNEGQNSASFNIQSPVKGIYVLRITDGTTLVTKKVIIN